MVDGIMICIFLLSIAYIVYQIIIYIHRCKLGREWDKIVNNDANFIPVSKMYENNGTQPQSFNYYHDYLKEPVSSGVGEHFPINNAVEQLRNELPTDEVDEFVNR